MRFEIDKSSNEARQALHVLGLEEVQALAREGYAVIPLIERMEQTETAGALYERLRTAEPSFLLESAEPEERQGRYSFIGLDPEKIIRLEKEGMKVNGQPCEFDDPYTFVQEVVGEQKVAPVAEMPPFFGGAAGYFGYDLARYREPTIGPAKDDKLDLPELALIVPSVTVAFDHYRQEMSIINNVLAEPGSTDKEIAERYQAAIASIYSIKERILTTPRPESLARTYPELEFNSNMEPDEFKDAVNVAKEHTFAGDVFQCVPSQRFSSDKTVDSQFAYEVFRRLKRLNPSRYAFHIDFGDFQIAGCSPETLVKVVDGKVEHHAIAGTIKRGANDEEDAKLAKQLRDDPKETAEHLMLVDLARNDVGHVCEPGSVEVPILRAIERYSHVLHGTSVVTGDLSDDKSALDVLASINPSGTLSGAPKIRAMQIIDDLERDKRGPYGGAVGYVTPKGDLDTCIFIRSLVVDKEGRVHVQAGAGIVADSVPESEYRETIMKAAAVRRAIDLACKPAPPKQQILEMPTETTRSRRKVAASIGKVLMIDNYDSFTYNLVDFLGQQGAEVEVVHNDITRRDLMVHDPDFVVVSPGPGHPREAGISGEALRYFGEKGVPALGVCLGHQALVAAYGGEVVRHEPNHGKTSYVHHNGQGVFKDLPKYMKVMRYHSLIADPEYLPDELIRTAYTEDDDSQQIIMGVRHKDLPHLEGVQFHPESYFTNDGLKMIGNFLRRGESLSSGLQQAS